LIVYAKTKVSVSKTSVVPKISRIGGILGKAVIVRCDNINAGVGALEKMLIKTCQRERLAITNKHVKNANI